MEGQRCRGAHQLDGSEEVTVHLVGNATAFHHGSVAFLERGKRLGVGYVAALCIGDIGVPHGRGRHAEHLVEQMVRVQTLELLLVHVSAGVQTHLHARLTVVHGEAKLTEVKNAFGATTASSTPAAHGREELAVVQPIGDVGHRLQVLGVHLSPVGRCVAGIQTVVQFVLVAGVVLAQVHGEPRKNLVDVLVGVANW